MINAANHYAVTLEDVLAELRALRQRVEVLEAQQTTKKTSDLFFQETTDAALLMAMASSTRGHVFSAKELLEHAVVDDTLRAALAGFTARRLGKKLRALAGCPMDGLMIVRAGRDNSGSLWVVQVV